MMNYNLNSYVDKKEAAALKEMIFNRVRERSASMNEEVQTDIMDIARESFVSKNNPFSEIIQNAAEKAEKIEKTALSSVVEKRRDENIGFPQKIDELRALEQNKLIQEQMVQIAVQSNMNEAREALSNKKSFIGALNFLNSQGAVSLLRTRADKFEVVS